MLYEVKGNTASGSRSGSWPPKVHAEVRDCMVLLVEEMSNVTLKETFAARPLCLENTISYHASVHGDGSLLCQFAAT